MPIVLAMLAVAASAAAALPWFTPSDRRPTVPEAAVAATVGLCVAGLVLLLARVAGAEPWAVRLTVIAVIGAAGVAVVGQRGWAVVPRRPDPSDPLSWIAFGLALAWCSPIVMGAWLMGRGDYPAMFFNVDTPFRLNHVHELLRGAGFPPQSIANVGVAARDHFGGPAVAAAIATVTGLAPHTAMFAVALPVAGLGVFSAAVLLTDRLVDRSARPLWLAALGAVLTAWVLPVRVALAAVSESLASGGVGPVRAMLGTVWRDPQSFNNYVEDITHSLGRALLLVVFTAIVAPGRRSIAAATLAVVLLGQAKTGHVVMAGIALAVACGWEAWRSRRAWPLVALAVGGAASLLLVRLGGVGSLFRMAVEPFWMLRHFPDVAVRDALTFAAVVAVPAALLLVGRRGGAGRPGQHEPAVRLVAVMALVYGFFQVVGAYGVRLAWQVAGPGREAPYRELLEPLLQMPIVVACLVAAIGAMVWSRGGRGRRMALVVFVAVLVVPALVHRIRGTVLMALDPVRAHEHADNRAIGEALGAIPVAGAVVATNDLLYPANNYGRDLLQFQLSAVRGHQAFALPGYERYPGWEARVALQQALARADAGAEALAALAAAGATHLVVHRRAPHPDTIARPMVYRGPEYLVYQLRHPQP